MPADWIRMRTNIYHNPKVGVMADLILGPPLPDDGRCDPALPVALRGRYAQRRVTRNAVCGALVSVWGNARHLGRREGDSLVIPMATLDSLDDIADIPGFGAAMCAVGWAVMADGVLTLPRFFSEFNAEPRPEKAAQSAARQQRYRDRKSAEKQAEDSVTRYAQRVTSRCATVTGEKSREEKSREEVFSARLAGPPDGPYPTRPADGQATDPGKPLEPHGRPSAPSDPSPADREVAERIVADGGVEENPPPPLEEFLAAWNASGLPPRAASAKLRGQWQAAWRAGGGFRDRWVPAIARAAGQSRCRVGGAFPLAAEFFLTDPNATVRILSGEFDDRPADRPAAKPGYESPAQKIVRERAEKRAKGGAA